MKGIILAAGKGTRLYPMTIPVCKPLLPVYDKPLIYYPVSTLMEAGIREIMIIIPPGEEKSFRALLGDGSRLGIDIQYREQKVPRGIADAFIIAGDFIGADDVCLVLGDNIFYGDDFTASLKNAEEKIDGAVVYGYRVDDPRPFGVIEFDESGKAVSIEEKPEDPKSDYIIPGLYFYDSSVVEIAKNLRPSDRGELEITDVNIRYMKMGKLDVIPVDRGLKWIDAGTADSLFEAARVVRELQKSGKFVGCIEETAWKNGFTDEFRLRESIEKSGTTEYGQHLKTLIGE